MPPRYGEVALEYNRESATYPLLYRLLAMYKIRTILGVMLFATLLSATLLATSAAGDGGTSFASKPREITVQKHARWMLRLPDTVPLSQVSLPGTHDSGALYDGLSFGFARCQSWRLADQLEAGIRFLDIRCRHVGDKLLIYHGVIDQRATFTDVRDACRSFLQKNPSECIVMSVKEESIEKDNSRSFEKTFLHTIMGDGELWYVSRETPALGAVRNRIVLVDRVGALGGLPWGKMDLQDRYNAPLDLKAKLIRSHFDKASETNDPRWFINFCSGSLPRQLITPRRYAAQSNQAALEYLRLRTNARIRLGAVLMDFPGDDLVEQIIETNFADEKAK